MYRDAADREIAEEAWQEYEAGLSQEELDRVYAPQPVLTEAEWEECWASMRGAGEELF